MEEVSNEEAKMVFHDQDLEWYVERPDGQYLSTCDYPFPVLLLVEDLPIVWSGGIGKICPNWKGRSFVTNFSELRKL